MADRQQKQIEAWNRLLSSATSNESCGELLSNVLSSVVIDIITNKMAQDAVFADVIYARILIMTSGMDADVRRKIGINEEVR